jgi:hypothetical protein
MLPMDTSNMYRPLIATTTAAAIAKEPKPQVCFLVWSAITFPLVGTQKEHGRRKQKIWTFVIRQENQGFTPNYLHKV